VTWTEAAAAVITLISVYLSARQNIWSWPTAIAGVGIYVLVFWHSKLYADMGLQFVYIALSIYGWYEWLHGGENKSELKVTSGWRSSYPIALAITIAFALGLGTFLRKTTDAALPYADASLTSFSLLAQWMMTKKYIENWWLWIAVDVFYVAMFTFKHLYLTALLYAVFIGVCWFAYVEWRRSLVPSSQFAVRSSQT
jgi:nicotinamide mononucleotide transporter